MTPDSRIIVSDRFQDNYAAYNLSRPDGVPGILGAMTFKHNPDGTLDPNTLLLGGGAASPGGALYEVKVLRGENGHIIGFDNDDDPETPYTATYFADSPYSDAGLVYTPDNVLLANMWKPAGVLSIKPGGVPNQTYPLGLGGLTFVPEGIPGEGQLKATGAYPGSGFYTVKYSLDGNFADGTPRYKFELPPHLETVAGWAPGAFVYMPVTAPNFEGGAQLLMVEWNGGGIYAYELDDEGNPIPSTRTPFITNYGGGWGGTTDPVTGDLLFNAWEGYNNVMVVRGLGQPTDNEPGMENWLVYVDNNRDGIQQPNEPFTYTDATGKYSFTLTPGTYRIVSQLQPGWTQTSPISPTYQDVIVTANDLKFGIDFAATNSKLAGPNIDPEITSIPPTTVKAGEKLVYRTTATDLNNDDLTFELVLKPKGMAIAPNGTISWRPSLDSVGIENVIVRVNDGRGGIDIQSFQIEVTPGNNPPIFTSQLPDNTQPQVNEPFQYQAVALDKDGDTITYELVPNPSKPVTPTNATINPTTGVITWTPTAAQQGGAFNWVYTGEAEPWEILIKATDNQGGEAFQRLELIVNPLAANQPPEITSKPRTTTRLGDAYFYQIEAIDPEGNPLTYSIVNPPVGMTIDKDKGVIAWTPTASQLGVYPLAVTVSDGKSLVTQSFSLVADNISLNQSPNITSTPEQITNLGRQYEYDVKGNDPDNDRLLWSLDSAPLGMLIDPISGAIRWQSTASQVGENTVVVKAIDGNGGYAVQEFTVTVRGVNTPPSIVSAPVTKAANNQLYSYQIVANDLENDPITFTLGKHPVGMTVDGEGKIQWTPQSSEIGQQVVEVIATDKQGASATQSFTVNTGTDAINQPPVISSTPVFTAGINEAYSYQVVATDADGQIAQYQLIEKPLGMTINEATGVISWMTTPEPDNYQVVVGVVDNLGAGSAQGFTLIVRENSAPVIPNVESQQEVTLGNVYRYDLKATDAQDDLLTFALVEYPNGMTIDEYGRISWTPSASDIGTNKPVEITVTDSFGSISTVAYNLNVVADAVRPKVNVSVSSTQVNKGDSVTFTVNAVDNVKVESLGLTINGTPVILDAVGQATVNVSSLEDIKAVATAKDAAGNFETDSEIVKVIAPSNVNFPSVSINLEDDVEISAPLQITGTISDSNSLDYYILEVAPVGGGEFKEIYRNDNPVNVNNDVIATFDPTVLANDAYILRVKAVDKGGNASTTERVVNVAGDLKLGNFRLSFTDLSIPVSGIPITVTRSYDSLNAKSSDDFGYGWRLEFRDTDLRTSLKSDPVYEELGIHSVPFTSGTKVFITLPGGKRETFTFSPTPDRLNSYLAAAGPGGAMYHPAFKSQDGSTSTLTVKDAYLTRNGNEYYGVNGEPFNPENLAFGAVYILTTKEGIVYEIDANSGDLLTATDTNGNKLTFSDAGIKSSSGKEVTFGRDASGRIVNVVDPAGEKVEYEYDAKGDLVAVTDREDNKTRFVYEDEDRKHFLTEVIDPLGRSGVRTEYDDSGRLKQMIDASGSAVELVYDPDNSVQKVQDVFGKETTYVYDLRGNVLTEIDPLGKRIDRIYDGDNNVLSETVITTELDSLGNPVEGKSTTEWTYDGSGNKLSEKDALGNVSRWSYNSRGQVLTETDALGNSTTNTYSPSGNLRSTKDAAGNVTKFDYDLRGNLLTLTDAAGDVSRFEYDASGNVISVKDTLGNVTNYTYNGSGDRLSETRFISTPNGLQEIVTKSTYDSNGKVKSTTDALNRVTKYEYDANGNQLAVIDALNRRTEYRYDEKGQLIETIYPDDTPNNSDDNPRDRSQYDAAGRLVASYDKLGKVTKYKYDDVGRLIETIYPDITPNTDADNPRSGTEYYQNGDVKAEIDELGNRTEYRYNINGQLVEVIYADDTPSDLTDNPRSKTEYDKLGRTIASIDSLGRVTRYEYDSLGRLVKTIYPDLTPNNLADNPIAKTEYDKLGRRISTTDAAGKTVKYEYDALGRLTDVVQFLSTQEVRTEYGYDELGRLIWQEDAEDNKTEFEYDKNGRRVAVELPLNQRSSTTYDAVGNVETVTDFNGHKITYKYDVENRLVSKEFANTGEVPVKFTYTVDGQIKTIVDGQETTTFNYDERGRLISRIDPDGPYLTSDATIEYEYDVAGNRTKVTTPNGSVSYTFDEQNRLKTVTDSDNQVTSYLYDDAGNLSRTELPNGVVESRTYDELNRLKLLEYEKDGVTLQSFDYSLDLVGHRQVVTEVNNRQVGYEYDDLYRLTKETIFAPDGTVERTISYGYDLVGNRLTKTDSVEGVTIYTYDDNDRLKKEELTKNGVKVNSVEYGYDDNGNTKERVKKDATGNVVETVIYEWNQENRLIGVQTPNSLISYEYDADGVRVSKTVNGVTTEYLVDKNRDYAQVLEESVNHVLAASYVYGLDLISQERGNDDSYYLVDGLGSTRGLTDGGGNVTDTYTYDAFGNAIKVSGGTDNSYLFAGEQFDEGLGQYYLRQRYYDSRSGRFTRKDTYEGSFEDPMSLHDYLYAHANPVNFTDPTGLYTLGELQAAHSIANTLAGIQWQSGGYLISATLNGGDYDGGDFFKDFLINAGATGGIIFFSWAVRNLIKSLSIAASEVDDLVRVYRVEGEANARIIISEAGEVLIQGDGTLFLTFGQRSNAEEYLKNRLVRYSDSKLKSFEVPKSYADDVRARAVPERGSRNRAFRDRPIKVHPRKEGDYGLRSQQDIEQLQRAILQGSGRIES